MEMKQIAVKYTPAEGPDGLMKVLEVLLEQSQKDPNFAAQDHYVLYQLGGQRSLMKVDLSKPPYQFYYNDLLGRPVTNAVKETLAKFLWEKCGEKERGHLHDYAKLLLQQRLKDSEQLITPGISGAESFAEKEIQRAIPVWQKELQATMAEDRKLEEIAKAAEKTFAPEKQQSNWSRFFGPKPAAQAQEPLQKSKNKTDGPGKGSKP